MEGKREGGEGRLEAYFARYRETAKDRAQKKPFRDAAKGSMEVERGCALWKARKKADLKIGNEPEAAAQFNKSAVKSVFTSFIN